MIFYNFENSDEQLKRNIHIKKNPRFIKNFNKLLINLIEIEKTNKRYNLLLI